MIWILSITGAILLAVGSVWWRRQGVSAERPASLLICFGAGMLIIAAAMFTSKFDVRGCPPGTPALDAAQGTIICQPPQTTMYGLRKGPAQ